MQMARHDVEIPFEQVSVHVERHSRGCPGTRCTAFTVAPALPVVTVSARFAALVLVGVIIVAVIGLLVLFVTIRAAVA